MRQINDNIIPLRAAATVHSAAIPALNLFEASVQGVFAGAAVGTLVLEASNDNPKGAGQVPVNFSTIATVAVSAAGVVMIPKTDLCYEYVRVSYTNTGTGTMSIIFKALGD